DEPVLAREGSEVLAVDAGVARGGGQVAVMAREDVREVATLEVVEHRGLGFRVRQVAAHREAFARDRGRLEANRQIGEPLRAGREGDRTVEHVAQLANVARPAMREQAIETRTRWRL